MINEEEALWAGIAVAVMMLGGGFSMLFLQAFTGYGAVVLALGLMTMALTIQMRAKPIEQFETPTPYEAQVLTSTPPLEALRETAETQPSPESSQVEAKTEQPTSEPHKEPVEEVKPTEPTEHVEPASTEPTQPTQPVEQPATEPPQPPQPQAPSEEKTEPPKSEETPKEEPQAVVAAN